MSNGIVFSSLKGSKRLGRFLKTIFCVLANAELSEDKCLKGLTRKKNIVAQYKLDHKRLNYMEAGTEQVFVANILRNKDYTVLLFQYWDTVKTISFIYKRQKGFKTEKNSLCNLMTCTIDLISTSASVHLSLSGS